MGRTKARLPSEEELIALLRETRRHRGYGPNVQPPVDFARQHAIAHGLSDALAEAVVVYREGLIGLATGVAQTAKRRADYLLLLAGHAQDWNGQQPCWSSALAPLLARLDPETRRAAEQLVLELPMNDTRELSEAGARPLARRLGGVGTDIVWALLDLVTPELPRGPVVLQTAGTHLLKNLLWLGRFAAELDAEGALSLAAYADALARVDATPRRRFEKIDLALVEHFLLRGDATAGAGLDAVRARNEGARGVVPELVRTRLAGGGPRRAHGRAQRYLHGVPKSER